MPVGELTAPAEGSTLPARWLRGDSSRASSAKDTSEGRHQGSRLSCASAPGHRLTPCTTDRARDLLTRLEAHAGDGASGEGGALAVFDAGYLIEAYKQARIITGRDIVDPARDGEAVVREARNRCEKDPDMEYAVGLIARGKPRIKSSR